MTSREARQKVQDIAARIRQNVDLYWTDVRSYEDFGAEQSRLWGKAERLGLAEQVTRIVRPRLSQAVL